MHGRLIKKEKNDAYILRGKKRGKWRRMRFTKEEILRCREGEQCGVGVIKGRK